VDSGLSGDAHIELARPSSLWVATEVDVVLGLEKSVPAN